MDKINSINRSLQNELKITSDLIRNLLYMPYIRVRLSSLATSSLFCSSSYIIKSSFSCIQEKKCLEGLKKCIYFEPKMSSSIPHYETGMGKLYDT